MRETLRSLNLSNSVAIIAYEVERQKNFERLEGISSYFDEDLL
jgi:tRNA(Leu) C34 or U34 (ribose-2'-O)-methylase TrmL